MTEQSKRHLLSIARECKRCGGNTVTSQARYLFMSAAENLENYNDFCLVCASLGSIYDKLKSNGRIPADKYKMERCGSDTFGYDVLNVYLAPGIVLNVFNSRHQLCAAINMDEKNRVYIKKKSSRAMAAWIENEVPCIGERMELWQYMIREDLKQDRMLSMSLQVVKGLVLQELTNYPHLQIRFTQLKSCIKIEIEIPDTRLSYCLHAMPTTFLKKIPQQIREFIPFIEIMKQIDKKKLCYRKR